MFCSLIKGREVGSVLKIYGELFVLISMFLIKLANKVIDIKFSGFLLFFVT